MPDVDTKYRLRDAASLPWREIDGEVIALDLGSGTYLNGNATGSFLWRMLAVGATRQELVSALADEFEVGPEQALADVDAFMGELRTAGLLEN